MRKILFVFSLLLVLSFCGLSAQNNTFGQHGNPDVTNQNAPKGEDEGGIFLPNAFTPNGDGVNDVYYIPDANFITFEFTVFDRWGNQVFTTKNASFRWAGDSNGRQLTSGIYVYVLTASTVKAANIKRSGTITIVR